MGSPSVTDSGGRASGQRTRHFKLRPLSLRLTRSHAEKQIPAPSASKVMAIPYSLKLLSWWLKCVAKLPPQISNGIGGECMAGSAGRSSDLRRSTKLSPALAPIAACQTPSMLEPGRCPVASSRSSSLCTGGIFVFSDPFLISLYLYMMLERRSSRLA